MNRHLPVKRYSWPMEMTLLTVAVKIATPIGDDFGRDKINRRGKINEKVQIPE